MPIYEYKCQDCGTQFEALRSIKDADTSIHCEHCASSATKRMLSTCNCQTSSGGSSHASAGCGGCSGGSCGSCNH